MLLHQILTIFIKLLICLIQAKKCWKNELFLLNCCSLYNISIHVIPDDITFYFMFLHLISTIFIKLLICLVQAKNCWENK